MRLWHQQLIPHLPRAQLLGLHREICALRGLSWGKKHSVVDYVFKYSPFRLFEYHLNVIYKMIRRKYNVDTVWMSPYYRGKRCEKWKPVECWAADGAWMRPGKTIYPEHNDEYLRECLENLRGKGIEIDTKEQKNEG